MSAAINYADRLPCRAQKALNQYDDSIPAHVESACDQYKTDLAGCIECGQDYTNGPQKAVDVSEAIEYIVQSINDGEVSDATLAQIVHAALLAADDAKQAVVATRLVRQAIQPFINEFVAGKADELQTELLKGE